MATYTLACDSVRSFSDFIEVVNRDFCSTFEGKWSGNMDALNDYLYWPPEEAYVMRLLGAEQCRAALNHAAYALWLEGVLAKCHPSNRESIGARLALARQQEGPTLFDFLVELLQSHKSVTLVLG